MKKTTALLCALALAAPAAVAQQKKAPKAAAAKTEAPAAAKKESKMVKTDSGLGYEDLVVGTGPSP
jgi:FKBP-type peptidyl-prolyl cis-trans isomerase